ALPRRVAFAKVKCTGMCISVLISRDAHQNGLEANATLRGKPEGPTRPGCVSLVTFFAQAKKVTRQQAKKGLSKPDKTSANKPSHMSHVINQCTNH
ncbi:MAG TPA: hypothetical protein VFY78_12865, partial [Gammaproteobacteria bacterium]|nr:hypothetical protein [Gammaproteobacteria bacterium]